MKFPHHPTDFITQRNASPTIEDCTIVIFDIIPSRLLMTYDKCFAIDDEKDDDAKLSFTLHYLKSVEVCNG